MIISAIPPILLKSNANRHGVPIAAIDAIRDGTANRRADFYQAITMPFYGFNRPGAKISQGIRDNWWRQGMSVKLLKNGTRKSYPGFPHGMPTTNADQINADLLTFIES